MDSWPVAPGDYSSAIQSYTAAIDIDSSTALFYTKRAAAYVSLKKYAQALKDLDRAIELDGSFTQGYLHRGRLHRQVCSLTDAKQDFETVLELKPSHPQAPKELQTLSELQSAVDELQRMTSAAAGSQVAAASEQLLERVYSIAPDCVPAQLLQAKLNMVQRNHEQAIAATGQIVKSNPRHLEALTLRGLAYMYLGDHDLAKRHFGEALKYDPDHKDSRQAFNKLKDLDRKWQRAARASEAQDFAEAEQQYTAALAVDPQHHLVNKELQLQLCRVRLLLDKGEQAVQACEAALAVDSGLYAAHKELIRALLAAKRHDEAVNKARMLLQQHQNDGEVHQLYREAEKQQKMAKRKDYYKILGVSQQADIRDIKKAYKSLAKQYHPDKVHSQEDKEKAEAKFREIAEAHEVLSDDEKRAAYDKGEDVEHSGAGGPGWGREFHQGFQQQGGYTFSFTFG
eukprot:GHRR01017491.1.p1 GENE.GHRR01017491.1~~GHRR01017491.1.p1  ORF type:complete len:455 (+),score=141.28 GHRR01017491.1:1053-2417(+)